MLTAVIEKEISDLKNYKSDEQLDRATSIILESPNGESPYVFRALTALNSINAYRLSGRIHSDTGLMNPNFFRESVQKKLNDNGTYALISVSPSEVMGLKAYLKTNYFVKTKLICRFSDDLIGVWLPVNSSLAKKILENYACGFAESNGSDVNELYNSAFSDLYKNKEEISNKIFSLRLDIADNIDSDISNKLAKYLSLKKKINQLL